VKDGQFFYRANLLGEAGATAFADRPSPITGISSFYKDKSKTINYGGEASFGLFVGFSRSKTTSKTSTYFADVNGDQLPDIVSKGIVYFNHLDPETGAIEYRPTSRGTPNVITSSKAIENDLFDKEALERDRQEAIDQNPLVDIVRMWRAPFDGTISVTAPIEFLQSDDKERPDAPADGVRVAIQLQNVELWSDTIGAVEYGTHEPPVMNNLQVRQGDQLFFRLGSRDHGRYDSIRWQPVIEYTDKDADLRDANGKLVYRFSAAEDFLLASAQTVSPPFDGELKLTGAFHKPKTTDDVALFVIREREGSDADTVWRRKFAWHEVIVKLPDTVISVKQADVYRLQLVSQTNIDWTAVQWKPRLLYTSVADPSVKLPDSIDFLPAVDYSLYVNTVRFADPVRVKLDSAGQRDTLQISPRLLFTIDPYEPFYEKELTFSVKKTDTLLAKRTIKIRNGEIVSDSALSVPVVHDDTLFIEVHADDYSFVLKLSGYKASYSIAGRDTTVQAGFYTVAKKTLDEDDAIFGNLYRGWGHFGWNANRHWVDEPIDPTLLKISQKAKDQGEMNTDGMTGDDLEKMDRYNPKADRFLLLVPDVRTGQWTSGDQFAYLAADVMSSSRLGDDDLSILTIAKGDTGEELIPGIEKVSKSNGKGSTLGVSLGLGASKSESDAYSYTLTDYMDLNGDRYPDIISEKKIQYTGAHGGLSDKITSGVGISQETHATTDGYALSGSMPMAMPKFRKSNKNGSTTQTDAGDAASTSGGASLSAGTTTGTNDASYTWVDMNGDGLPDRVDTFGQVALNLGYTFAAPETWAFEEIQSGGSETITGGVGLGFNFAQNSISGGISLARSDNFSNAALMDANGDGLPDRVKKGEPLQVWINTGSGFAQDPVSWNGASAISENATASESANASFTVGFTALTVKWNVSPSGSVGKAMSRETSKFTDMNGDGYPDFVKSTDENDLDVYPSTIGRTNLLKSVQRPLGASFAMTYSYIGNSYEMPNGVWALDSVKVADGFAGDGVDNMATAFAYEDGRYDRREREFYGFGKVITNSIDTEDNANTVYTSVTQTFANDNYYAKGLLLSEL
ncbi:MAG TPA: toxin TcdB middle/N-terminal domain-containing protein, partial [Chryseosolibacter sp.]|nr:toxin TcdB middle/N-terminal domain-containing protein [Chryseosolibacter sp.]